MHHLWSASPAPDCTSCWPCAAIQPSKCMPPRSTGSHTWAGHVGLGQQLTAGQHHVAEVCAHSEPLMGASAAPARMLWCSCLVQARNGGTCQCTLPTTCTMHGTESSCAAAMHLEMCPLTPFLTLLPPPSQSQHPPAYQLAQCCLPHYLHVHMREHIRCWPVHTCAVLQHSCGDCQLQSACLLVITWCMPHHSG